MGPVTHVSPVTLLAPATPESRRGSCEAQPLMKKWRRRGQRAARQLPEWQARLPIRRVPVVWHIGTEPSKPPNVVRFQDSVEGHALSVTTHPDAWAYIAKLGGPWWRMTGPGRFLDIHALGSEGIDALIATRPDLAQRTEKWQAPRSYADAEEEEAWSYFEMDTEEEAWAQVDPLDLAAVRRASLRDDPDDEDVGRVRPFLAWTSTPKLNALRKRQGLKPANTSRHAAASALIEVVKEMPNVDGLWWEDELDPHTLSAPRGALFPERLRRWRWKQRTARTGRWGQRARFFAQPSDIPVKKARAVASILSSNGTGTHQDWELMDVWVAAAGLRAVLSDIGRLYAHNKSPWSTGEESWWISQLSPEEVNPVATGG